MTSYLIPTFASRLRRVTAPRRPSIAIRLRDLLQRLATRPIAQIPDRLIDDVDPGQRGIRTRPDLGVRLGRWLY